MWHGERTKGSEMARLHFNVAGYTFETGLDQLRRAYDKTTAALEEERCRLEIDLQNVRAAGEAEAMEYDASGEPLYRREQLHEMLLEDAAAALCIARSVYVVALHHYWEKCCKSWMEARDYDYEEAYRRLRRHGLSVDSHGLEVLRKACNRIKHRDFELRIEADAVDAMFDAVRSSGITSASTAAPPFRPRP